MQVGKVDVVEDEVVEKRLARLLEVVEQAYAEDKEISIDDIMSDNASEEDVDNEIEDFTYSVLIDFIRDLVPCAKTVYEVGIYVSLDRYDFGVHANFEAIDIDDEDLIEKVLGEFRKALKEADPVEKRIIYEVIKNRDYVLKHSIGGEQNLYNNSYEFSYDYGFSLGDDSYITISVYASFYC